MLKRPHRTGACHGWTRRVAGIMQGLAWMSVSGLGVAQSPMIGCEDNVQWVEVGGDRLIFTQGGATAPSLVAPWRITSFQRRQALANLVLPEGGQNRRLSVGRDSIELVTWSRETTEQGMATVFAHYGMDLQDLLAGRRSWTLRGTHKSFMDGDFVALDDTHILKWNEGGMPWPTPSDIALWVILKRNEADGTYRAIKGGDWPTPRSPYVVSGPGRWRSRYPGLTHSPVMAVSTPEHVVLVSPLAGYLLVFDRGKRDLVGTLKSADQVDESWLDRWNSYNPIFFAKATPTGTILLGMRRDRDLAEARAFELEHRASPEGLGGGMQQHFARLEWRELSFKPMRLVSVDLPGDYDMLTKLPRIDQLCLDAVPWVDGRLLYERHWDPAETILKALNPPKPKPIPAK